MKQKLFTYSPKQETKYAPPGLEVHTCIPRTWEAETGKESSFEFKARLLYIVISSPARAM